MKGDPSKLIQNFETTSQNYDTAWNELLQRYDNKVLLLNKHIKAFFVHPLANKGSGASLRRVISDCVNYLSSIENLKFSSLLENILVYILLQKLDSDSLFSFQMQQDTNEIPRLLELKILVHEMMVHDTKFKEQSDILSTIS